MSHANAVPQLPPGPTDHPFVQVSRFSKDPLAFLTDCSRRYGDFFTLRFPGQEPFIHVASAEGVKDVFAGSPDDFRAGESTADLEFVFGPHSIVRLDGEKYTRARKLIMQPLYGERMAVYGQRIQALTLQAMADWKIGEPFSAREAFTRITLETMLECVFGVSQGPHRDRLARLYVNFLDGSLTPGMLLLFNLVPGTKFRRFLVDRIAPLADKLTALAGAGRLLPGAALSQTIRELDEILYAHIRQQRAASGDGRDDVLSLLIAARDENGEGLTDAELHDQMVTLLFAGHETTATTLTWMLSEILNREDVFAEVMREIDTVFGGGPVEPSKVHGLTYLDAVGREALRLYPTVPTLSRRLNRPARVGGRDLPAGVVVMPSIYLLQRNPAIWPSPDRFDPKRFIDKKPKPYEFIPFGGGPRICAGMAFAMYEMKLVIATILTHAKLRHATSEIPTLAARGFMFGPSNGVPLVLTERKAQHKENAPPPN